MNLFRDDTMLFGEPTQPVKKPVTKTVNNPPVPVVQQPKVTTAPPPTSKPPVTVTTAPAKVESKNPPEPPKVARIYLRDSACSPIKELGPKVDQSKEKIEKFKEQSIQTAIDQSKPAQPPMRLRMELPPDSAEIDKLDRPPRATSRHDSPRRNSNPQFAYDSNDFYRWVTSKKMGSDIDARQLLFSPTGKRRTEILPQIPQSTAKSLVSVTPTGSYSDPYSSQVVVPARPAPKPREAFSISDPIDHFVWGRIARPTITPASNSLLTGEPNYIDRSVGGGSGSGSGSGGGQAAIASAALDMKSPPDVNSSTGLKSLPDYSRPDYNSSYLNYFKPGQKYDFPPTI